MSEQPLRLFIAVELSDALKRALADTQRALRRDLDFPALRWVAPDSIHITLKFLGDTPPSLVPAMQDALAGIAPQHAPFEIVAADLGVFPSLARPAVLWVGLTGGVRALQAARDDVERVIAPLGYPTEKRPFSPHLTLARIKEPTRGEVEEVRAVVQRNAVGQLGTLAVHEISLMRSELGRGGARYTQLAAFPLGK